jgi:hypothetical protein
MYCFQGDIDVMDMGQEFGVQNGPISQYMILEKNVLSLSGPGDTTGWLCYDFIFLVQAGADSGEWHYPQCMDHSLSIRQHGPSFPKQASLKVAASECKAMRHGL